MKYDFILFEQLYSVENHYKDLCILAKLLVEAGYRVAIADAFKEAALCNVEGVPHLSIKTKCPQLFNKPQMYNRNVSGWKNLYYRIRKDIYLYNVIKELKGQAANIYLGSLTLATPVFFFKAFDTRTVYYMWALRSSHLLVWKKKGYGLYYFISKVLYKIVRKAKNLRLIISNELIKKEFEEIVGVPSQKIILRPERVIDEKCRIKSKKKGDSLNLLFIGTLRPFKNVEFCLEALRCLNDHRITYTIAGRCKTNQDYNKKIRRLSAEMPNVRRIDRYIPDAEYEELIRECDFVIFCDKKQASCASNGTMAEALLHGKPIIAPDIDPFKYEIEQNGVGYLYEYDNLDSICGILLKALKEEVSFDEKIVCYQKKYIFSDVAINIKNQIEQVFYE